MHNSQTRGWCESPTSPGRHEAREGQACLDQRLWRNARKGTALVPKAVEIQGKGSVTPLSSSRRMACTSSESVSHCNVRTCGHRVCEDPEPKSWAQAMPCKRDRPGRSPSDGAQGTFGTASTRVGTQTQGLRANGEKPFSRLSSLFSHLSRFSYLFSLLAQLQGTQSTRAVVGDL